MISDFQFFFSDTRLQIPMSSPKQPVTRLRKEKNTLARQGKQASLPNIY